MRSALSSLLALTLAFGLFACGGGSSAPPIPRTIGRSDGGLAEAGGGADEPSDSGTPANPLVGSWRHQIGDCEYTHTFDGADRYVQRATTGEVVEADYELEPTEADVTWNLSFTITSDNNVVDCEGQQNDETGASHSALLVFVGNRRVDVYRGANDDTPSFTWTRL